MFSLLQDAENSLVRCWGGDQIEKEDVRYVEDGAKDVMHWEHLLKPLK